MKLYLLFVVLLNSLQIYHVQSANLPGPLVYVVTPSSRSPQIDMGRAAPFYYRNWMKRMDTPSVTQAPTTEKTKTPDLIFAEFESNNNNLKSIRNLLQKETIETKTTSTTSSPIYVPDEDTSVSESNYGLPQPTTEEPKKTDMTDYFAVYNNLYNSGSAYVPSAPTSSVPPMNPPTTTTTTTTTTEIPLNNVENIWHIIDNEKQDQYTGKWTEVSVDSDQNTNNVASGHDEHGDGDKSNESQTENEDSIDDNFALPGFGTNPGNGGENESRAIRTEPSIRFPYVNLKPFKMKNLNSKKTNNMFDLGSFTEIKNPVRGEAQDTPVVPVRQPIDRYNPAQPYLPDYGIGTKSKQASVPPVSAPPVSPPRPPPARPPPSIAVANLVPPPLPPAPKLTADDFPTPSTYESFPPYANGDQSQGPSFSFPPTADSGLDSSSDDSDSPPVAPPSVYKYKPPTPVAPAPPSPSFAPTLPPLSKPFSGYSYNRPSMEHDDNPPAIDMDKKPDFQGYHYSKPAPPPPSPPQESPGPSYGHHDEPPPSYQPESDYPDLIFDKPHGSPGDMKGGDAMKGNDMGMMPPPPPSDMKPGLEAPPMDDHGFPPDFPGDFKYSHDFDEHDYHHYHHHHPTTTTTTEMPRVNRFSYYYLGKKLYYLPLYFSVYFVVYVGALIIKAVLRHKITYPNSYRPNGTTASFFSKRSIESHLSNENLHEITGRVTHAIATAAEKYISDKSKDE